jgi:hypothetical protein
LGERTRIEGILVEYEMRKRDEKLRDEKILDEDMVSGKREQT